MQLLSVKSPKTSRPTLQLSGTIACFAFTSLLLEDVRATRLQLTPVDSYTLLWTRRIVNNGFRSSCVFLLSSLRASFVPFHRRRRYPSVWYLAIPVAAGSKVFLERFGLQRKNADDVCHVCAFMRDKVEVVTADAPEQIDCCCPPLSSRLQVCIVVPREYLVRVDHAGTRAR